jgi:hypothetical protein
MIVFMAHAVFPTERSCPLINAEMSPGHELLACSADACEVTT